MPHKSAQKRLGSTVAAAMVALALLAMSCGITPPSTSERSASQTSAGSRAAAKRSPASGAVAPQARQTWVAPQPRQAYRPEGPGSGRTPERATETPAGPSPSRARPEAEDESVLHPQAGAYLYDQAGWDEFCQQGTCDRRDLPTTQSARLEVGPRSDDLAEVVMEAEVSDRRFVRTTFRFSRNAALITRALNRFDFNNITFTDEYRPSPPIRSLVFPLQEGSSWSGSWTDERAGQSGDYRIAVEGRERVTTAGDRKSVV